MFGAGELSRIYGEPAWLSRVLGPSWVSGGGGGGRGLERLQICYMFVHCQLLR